MHRDLVEKRKWIDEESYKEGLALAQLAPGPLAAQLAIYIGYIDYKYLGATLVGLAFVLPSFLIVVLLSIAYVNFGGLPWMQSIFYGVGASVIGIIAVSSYKLTKKTIGRESILWIIFIILAAFTAITETENIWLILAGGIGYLFYKSPKLLQKIFLSFLFLPMLSRKRKTALLITRIKKCTKFLRLLIR